VRARASQDAELIGDRERRQCVQRVVPAGDLQVHCRAAARGAALEVVRSFDAQIAPPSASGAVP
jgi:hypothetical protein